MPAVVLFAALIRLIPLSSPTPRSNAPDTVVICAGGLRAALDPWLEYRSQQGHRILVTSNTDQPAAIRQLIRRAAADAPLAHLVLVGDAPAPRHPSSVLDIPTHYYPATVNVRYGSEPLIASDDWYADLDDDGLADMAIGRIPADTPQELSVILQKSIDYESQLSSGLWRRRINLVAGRAGWGPLADSAVQLAAAHIVARRIPATYRTSVTHASPSSPFCPHPDSFRDVVLERLNEGCLFWIYIGHGQRQWLDALPTGEPGVPILACDDVARVRSQIGFPIAVFLSCYGAAFDDASDGLGERLLACPSGPVAVVGATRVAMPYGMAVLCDAMADQYFDQRRATLGQVLLGAKRRMIAPSEKRLERRALDLLASALSPHADRLADELRETAAMFHVLGDPLLKLPYPAQASLECPGMCWAGETLSVRGKSHVLGTGVVELAGRLGCRSDAAGRPRNGQQDAELARRTALYQSANEDRWVVQLAQVIDGQFAVNLQVPHDVHGLCYVRLFVADGQQYAVAAKPVFVRRGDAVMLK